MQADKGASEKTCRGRGDDEAGLDHFPLLLRIPPILTPQPGQCPLWHSMLVFGH